MGIDKIVEFLKKHKLITISVIVAGTILATATGVINIAKLTIEKLKRTIKNLRNQNLEDNVRRWANIYNIPEALAFAVITQESEGDPKAKRYEPNFYNKYIKDKPEWKNNPYYNEPTRISSSYGLMQVMYTTGYGVAKQLGILNRLKKPEDLYDPDLNLQIGMKYLRQMLDRYKGDPKQYWKAVADYNGGWKAWKKNSFSKIHANLVMNYMEEYKKALA